MTQNRKAELEAAQEAILTKLGEKETKLLLWLREREKIDDWAELQSGPGRPSAKRRIMDFIEKELIKGDG